MRPETPTGSPARAAACSEPPVRRRLVTLALLLAGLLAALAATLGTAAAGPFAADVTLEASLASGRPVGTRVTWTARATGMTSPIYQFSVGPVGGPLRIVRDFHRDRAFDWTPLSEGLYQVKVVARDGFGSTESVQRSELFEVVSRLKGRQPEVVLTDHPLVALYSAPPCPEGARVRVQFRALGSRNVQETDAKPCQSGKSVNFWVAGMRATSAYELRQIVSLGGRSFSWPSLRLTTGLVASDRLPNSLVVDPPSAETSSSDRVLLVSPSRTLDPNDYRPIAYDLGGNPIWYFDPDSLGAFGFYVTRLLPGGTLLAQHADGLLLDQFQVEIDLAGNVLRSTNVERVNEQLAARGDDLVGAFHHEATRLPNGQTLLFASVERFYEDVHGYPGTTDVLGDMVIALDEDWQVVWTWNAFDHLDVQRGPRVPRGLCRSQLDGCPPLRLAEEASDWLHSNSIAYSPTDGNIIVSIRKQDWVIKIDYRDGAGDGTVLWRLGRDGDFALTDPVGDPYPWFSGQHDASYLTPERIILYDNGVTRCAGSTIDCHSRGQVYEIDEANRTARLLLNADLGVYADAFGSAQQLANGNYHFTSGLLGLDPIIHAQSAEVLPDGRLDYMQDTVGVWAYRSYRSASLYRP